MSANNTLLDTATNLAIGAGNDKRLKSKAIKADVALLESHLGTMQKEHRPRAERTIEALLTGNRRYNADPAYNSILPPRRQS